MADEAMGPTGPKYEAQKVDLLFQKKKRKKERKKKEERKIRAQYTAIDDVTRLCLLSTDVAE